jgi:hemolysin III
MLQHTEEALKPRLRGVLHQAAFSASLASGAVLVALSGGAMEHVAAAVYAGAVALLFGTSAAYHRGTWSARARDRMERLDHSMIFVLIAGTYTPFTLLLPRDDARTMLLIVWIGAVAGVLFRVFWVGAPRWLYTPVYVALGWVAVFYLGPLLKFGGPAIVTLIAVGGLLYTAGAVVYGIKRPNPSPRWFGFHEIFHTLTVAAFVVHYIAASMSVYGAGTSA